MRDVGITQGSDPYVYGMGRRTIITAVAIMLNSLVLILFMWFTTFKLLRVGEPALVNVIASSIRSITLGYNAWRLRRFLKRGYSVGSVDEVARSFSLLELINSAALLAFIVGTLSSFEELGVPMGVGWFFILFKSLVLAYFVGVFVTYARLVDKNRETVHKKLRSLVTLAVIDSATIAIFMWLMWWSFNNSKDPRTIWLGIFAIAQTVTLLIILSLYSMNKPREDK